MKQYPRLSEQLLWRKLPNGLTVCIAPRPGFQKKLAYFVTDYGAIHTGYRLDGQTLRAPDGVAHFLEHKMFDLPRGEVSAEFAALGAYPNAFTSYDITAYYFSCTENFQRSLRLLLEFVSTPWFTEQSVAKEQGIIGQEIDMTADNADSRVFENLMAAMYEKHPIRTPILGTRESLAQITPQVLTQCHRAFYRPENMILCVVGDVDAAFVLEEAAKLPAGQGAVEKLPFGEEALTCVRSYVEQAMEIAMPTFQLGFKCAPTGKGEDAIRREIIGDLAAEALFGESSGLYTRMYEEGLIDSSFGGGFESVDGMSMLTASGDSDHPLQVRDAILAQVPVLLEQGLREEDLLRMKRSSLGRRIRDLDSFDSVCFRLCAYHFSGFDYFRFPELYEQITAGDVLDFLRENIRPERCCLSVIKPVKED